MNSDSKSETLLLFGPQALSFETKYFGRIRSLVNRISGNKWILDTVNALGDDFDALCKAIPAARYIQQGETGIRELQQWLEMGEIPERMATSILPNILLGPLTVIAQLVEYNLQCKSPFSEYPGVEAFGLCLGLLSAMVVGCSSNQTEFSRYGAAAIRLAMVIGAVVDTDQKSNGSDQYVSLATATRGIQDASSISKVLSSFPGAYISVLYDSNRATITCPKSSVDTLRERLKASEVTATEIGLRGRFHNGVHESMLKDIITFCNTYPHLRLPDASGLRLPVHGDSVDEAATIFMPLHEVALRAILLEPSDWIKSFAIVSNRLDENSASRVVSFGPERCIPPSAVRSLGSAAVHFDDVNNASPVAASIMDNDIAVVGMSCRVAGAEDPEGFWEILMEGQSQHREVSSERFGFETVFRPEADNKRKWYVDPQQRLLLQGAYIAMAQSGYFQKPSAARDNHIGCYIGVCATDYENNVSHHAPTAFTATGNLRSFIAGKVSHHFGWTGPSLTVDTACSASAVAIHSACKAILTGECSAALAGGTNFISSPLWYQNLAAASFLSPTGQCKPFDVSADGYCRGEAIATVVLKRLSHAVAEGDQILGVISSTAVYQNENCTPIFVPNAPSLSGLFKEVLRKSEIDPGDITYVEAHGTGTPVGDPAEFESIRRAFGKGRSRPLQLGSAKGLIGHTEGSSGVVSLIKVLLMMNEGYIPPQSSFKTLNPSIQSSPTEKIEIAGSALPWQVDNHFRAALINNYGASGSNASMVIKQAPLACDLSTPKPETPTHALTKYPFYIAGFDERSVRTYAARLRQFVRTKRSANIVPGIEDFSFNLARQSNWYLESAVIFSSQTLDELEQKLASIESGKNENNSQLLAIPSASRPVILCFGGQISTFVGLDRAVYDSIDVLRYHLDQCDNVCRSLGAESIYPEIFQATPIQDVSRLQPMLFSLQYACAMSWIDSGISPAALVGHSFGELTALCVAGTLSLQDSLKMVWGRSKIIRDYWGEEKGAMMAVEADEDMVTSLLNNSKRDGVTTATVACFNGPRSFTLAGSVAAIEAVASTLSTNQSYATAKSKRLSVTNAFHSTLVEKLKPELEALGKILCFTRPKIHLESSTKSKDCGELLSARYVANHMRDPVYFSQAVERLSSQHKSAIWLEAGSNSTITTMASRALGNPKSSTFQSINITSGSSLLQLTDATMSLWRAGCRISHWSHSRRQTHRYTPLILPPYQFDKQRHWIQFKAPPKPREKEPVIDKAAPTTLLTFIGYEDDQNTSPRFRVNTQIERYQTLVAGHVIAKTAPICPATLQVEMAVEGIISVRPDLVQSKMQPQICNVNNQAPICVNESREVFLEYAATSNGSNKSYSWKFKISSSEANRGASTTHVTGEVRFRAADDNQYRLDFGRLERLVNHQQCIEVLNSSHPDDEVIQGSSIYKVFSDVVDYGQIFFGLQKLVGRFDVSAGRVVKQRIGEAWLDPLLGDCFSQVGGIWVNCMANKSVPDMFIANGFEQWIKNPKLSECQADKQSTWHVLARHTAAASGNAFLTDIFVYEPESGQLVEAILGINYAKVAKASMSKLLSRLTPGRSRPTAPEETPSAVAMLSEKSLSSQSRPVKDSSRPGKSELLLKLKGVLAELAGLEVGEVKDEVELADIGIDSLMGMEMAREVETTFSCTLDTDELMQVSDLPQLFTCLLSALGDSVGDSDDGKHDGISSNSGSSGSSDAARTPSSTKATSVQDTYAHDLDLSKQHDDLIIPSALVLKAFGGSKSRTDHFIEDHHCSGYLEKVMPKQANLCIALTLEAFKELGCDLSQAKPGEALQRIPFDARHGRLVEYLYIMLEETRIVDLDGGRITRTALPPPEKSSNEILQQLLREHPDHSYANELTHWTGSNIAAVLRGEADGIKLIFGNEKGRELVAGLYGDSLLNKLSYRQMADFLNRLVDKLSEAEIGGTLRILEMGAGTGGTTKWLVPMLARLGMPVEYTFTDLAPSFVAAARKKFKEYPFMKFAVHDIEKPPSQTELLASQHIVIASNAVHATHSLTVSTENIRKFLRPDGMLLMLEMTQTLYWVDLIFGILEGWWLFDDGRRHAIADERRWEEELHKAGYGHVDWTDGSSPEVTIQKVFLALASGSQLDRLPSSTRSSTDNHAPTNLEARRAATNAYVQTATETFSVVETDEEELTDPSSSLSVLVTGATGSLGCHLVTHLASLPNVYNVYCLNRTIRGEEGGLPRQMRALESRGIIPDALTLSKLRVFESSDTSKPHLGLNQSEYRELARCVTHIVHNAWPMSGKRPVKGFESQFVTMTNLVDLAATISQERNRRVSFQFVSSIAVVGHYPLSHGTPNIPEEPVMIESVLPNGYGDAKYVCERILEKTLHRYPKRFRTMSVRLGQVAGSSNSGYWNHMEHFSFMVKTAQTLRALPSLSGQLSWTPVNDVAGTLTDLLLLPKDNCLIYHIDNPIRQPWDNVTAILARALHIPNERIVPMPEWLRRVRVFPGDIEENPALKLVDFLEHDFERMSCGGVLLGVERALEHSPTLRAVGPVGEQVVLKYVQAWKNAGFLR
ncbi:putative polyketide synthase [Truncatella angustata]|uniref:Polyketide synthase n=1 Tax=Truncatella angustata TaxID=152316 RepID=A0A9P8UVG1_9PEZI|nr:putative polyketide synthase [Truncatella angustata]KAH6658935.1 putative polyketide synthase [Truncatella angustata]